MDAGMIPAGSNGACDPFLPLASPTIMPSHPQITTPPSQELFYQHLQKRATSNCGFSGSQIFSCPLASYCIYNSGFGRWDCCFIGTDSVISSTCDLGQTICVGSAASVSLFGNGACSPGTACCDGSANPQCVTGILSSAGEYTYSSFWCETAAAVRYVTPMTQYAIAVTTTVSPDPTTVISSEIETSTQDASTITQEASTITQEASTVYITPTTSSIVRSSSTPRTTSRSTSSSGVTSGQLSTQSSSSASPSGTSLPNVDGATQSTSTWDQHKGAIIGGAVGGLAAIGLVALFLFIRHRKQVKKREAGLYDAPEMSGRVVSGLSYNSLPTTSYGS